MAKDKSQQLQEAFGTYVKSFRKEKSWTQSVLAEQADISLDMISRLERGTIGPSMKTIATLSEVLDVPVAVLFGGTPFSSSGNGKREERLQQIHLLLSEVETEKLEWIYSLLEISLKK